MMGKFWADPLGSAGTYHSRDELLGEDSIHFYFTMEPVSMSNGNIFLFIYNIWNSFS
jgi:hypothetical protein